MKRDTNTLKRIAFLISMLILVVMLQACGNTKDIDEKPIFLTSDVDYVITVPVNDSNVSDIFFQAPFYILTNQTVGDLDLDETYTLSIGKDILLHGENIDALSGGYISAKIVKFDECIDDDYYEKFAWDYGIRKEGNNPFDPVEKELINTLKDKINVFQENMFVIVFSIVYEGEVHENIRIEQLTWDKLPESIIFKNFKIETLEIDDSVEINAMKTIDYSTIGGGYFDGFIQKLNYYEINGLSKEAISELQLFSLNDECTVVNEENIKVYEEYANIFGDLLFDNKTNYNADELIEYDCSYIYDANEFLVGLDGKMASLAIQTNVGDKTFWDVMYIPSVRTGEYLIYKLID